MSDLAPDLLRHRMVTVAEVADLLQVTPQTVYNLIHRGEIPRPLKIGGATRWRLADIERWLEARSRADAIAAEPPHRVHTRADA